MINPEGKVVSYFGPWSDIEEVTPHVRKAVMDALNAKGPKRPPGGQPREDHEPYMEGMHNFENIGVPGEGMAGMAAGQHDGSPATEPTNKQHSNAHDDL